MCAAPAHTIQLEVANQQYQNGPMDTESVSKRFGLLRQLIRVYIEGRAQSVVGFGLETHTLRMCAAPAHTIQLEGVSRRYQNGPMDMESVSKRFGLLRQPIRVLY